MLARLAIVSMLFASLALAQSTEDPVITYTRRTFAGAKTHIPPSGYVPDSDTATAIATAVLIPIYGKEQVNTEKPWHTGLKDGVWTIVGSFNGKGDGGTAVVQLDKKTGRVLFVTHTM